MGKLPFPAFHSFGSIFAQGYEHEEILPGNTGFFYMEHDIRPTGNGNSPRSCHARIAS